MATVTGSKRHLDITSDTLTTSSNVDVGAKLFITTTDTNTTSTSALVLNSTEVETRTLGSLAFSGGNTGNWDTAYSWGNHASAGYGNMSSFILEDGDGTEVSISNGKEVKFVEGTGIDINWTDVSTGSDTDPYDLTFSVKNNSISAAQINVSGNGTSGQVLTSDGDGTMSWTNKTANTDTITSVGVANSEVSGTVTLSGAGATSLTQTDSTIEIRSTDTQYNDATTSTAGLMSTTDKTKLDGIATGAEVNVQSDWNSTTGDSFIQNKPTLGTASASAATDFISATNADTAAELITFAKGITTDGNSKFYNWRALDNTSSTGNSYWRIARITSSQSSRFMITLAGRSTSYSDNSLPAMGHIVGQLNNDNNYDVVFYNHSTASSEVVSEVGIINVSNTVVDVYIKAGQFAEITATGHISDGSFGVVSNTGSDGVTSVDGYVAVTEYTVMNTGNSDVLYKSGGTMSGDILLGTNSIAADTTSPTAHIQVGAGTTNTGNRSNVALLGEANSGGVVNALGLVNTATAANSNGVALNFHNANNYSPTGQILLQQNSSGTTTHSAMKFFTYGSNNLTHQMSIKSDGVVRFLSYGTGILSTDTNGNISAISDGTSGQVLTTNGSGGFSFTTVTSGTSYTLPTATDSVLGGIKVGDNLTITDGVLSATDTDTVYVHPTSAGNKHIPTGGAAGQFLKYSSSGTAVWATPSYTTNTNTTYSAGSGLDLTGTTFSVEADLRDGITHVGKDANNYIRFSTNGRIDFYAGGVFVARMESGGDLHIKGDVIAFSNIFA